MAANDFPVVIGGDHSIAIGTWSGVARASEAPVGLLWIDAHLDSHTPETSYSGAIHGMPLEIGAKVTTVVFDKTGTITEGRPVVSDWRNLSGLPDKELLGLLAAAENGSEHYLAKALREFAQLLAAAVDGEKVANFRVEPGHGIAADVDGRGIVIGNAEWLSACGVPTTALDEHCARAGMEGKTPVLAALDGQLAAFFAIADQPRADAAATIERLHRLGIKTLMATGDVEAAARHVAGLVGIDRVEARATPERKLQLIRALQAAGEIVAMVGDGINDAPALAAADVSMARVKVSGLIS